MEQKLANYQTLREQLQMVSVQKQQMELGKAEAEAAKKALEGAKSDVYKSVGPLLIKVDLIDAKSQIDSELSTVDKRLVLLSSQETKLAAKLQEISKDLSAAMGASTGPTGA